jgi:hypothetical protein
MKFLNILKILHAFIIISSLHSILIFQYISNKMQRYTVHFIWKLLYMFRVVPSPIISNANNCIYSIWYLSHRYCYLPPSWESWNCFECAVGGVCQKTVSLTDLVVFSVASGSACVLNAGERASLTKPRKALLKLTLYLLYGHTLSYCKNCSA